MIFITLALVPGAFAVFEFMSVGAAPRVTTAVVAVGLFLCGLLSITAGLILHSIARRSQEFEYHIGVLADELRAGRSSRVGNDVESREAD
jgi:hypothetical protein